uniref:Uncharacterized protein n=1 Tax=Anguilla anguilla TaxID=7936 RepID=A0A0E9RRG9_ANGAN
MLENTLVYIKLISGNRFY